MGFFKSFLKGLLYVILSPFILTGFAIFAVYSIGVFIFESIVWFVKFAKGDKLTIYTPEDEQVYIMIQEQSSPQVNQTVNNTTVDNSTTNTDNSSHNTENKTVINNIIVDNPELAKQLLEAQKNGETLNIEELQKKILEMQKKQLENKPKEIEIIETEDLPQLDMADPIDESEPKDEKADENKKEENSKPEDIFPNINVDENNKQDYGDFPDFDE